MLTDYQKNYIRKNCRKKTLKDIAKKLKLSYNRVYAYAYKEGFDFLSVTKSRILNETNGNKFFNTKHHAKLMLLY